ncbi:MAG TPA: hypothetical protein VMK84_13790 [Streptosporangiaceae bacterium]|nr:hypothetical protein [Streptosporangiaceae bacterium]
MRSDVHTLFDRGYLGVDPQHGLRQAAPPPRPCDPLPGGLTVG